MANEWLTHVKEVMKSSPELAFKDVLKKAKKTWKKNGDTASKGKTKAKAKTKSKSKSKSKTRKNRPKRYPPKVVGGKKPTSE